MELKSRIGNFYSGNTIILAVILILVAVLVSVFNAYYYTSTLNDQRGQELAQLFSSSNKGFSDTAKDILDTRSDILYIKLTNPDGVLIESYGDGENQTAEIFPIRTPDNNTIVLGVTPREYKSLALSAIMWSALIGIAFTVFFVFIGSFFSTGKNDSIEKLIAAMKTVARGDLSARLNPDSADDVSVIRAYETFNQMLDRLRKRDDLEIEDDVPPFQPTLITSEHRRRGRGYFPSQGKERYSHSRQDSGLSGPFVHSRPGGVQRIPRRLQKSGLDDHIQLRRRDRSAP
ncbi:MAG: HAMP domain-containing protein [Thermodesulfobacteriota bacterium]